MWVLEEKGGEDYADRSSTDRNARDGGVRKRVWMVAPQSQGRVCSEEVRKGEEERTERTKKTFRKQRQMNSDETT